MRTKYLLPLTLLCTNIEAAPIESEASTALTPRDAFSNIAPRDTCSGPGVLLSNKSNKKQDYVFYNNRWNGDGTAGPEYDHPDKTVTLEPGATRHVPLATTFKGRISRGLAMINGKFAGGTWAEFQLEAADDKAAHGNISVEQGCDGGATIASTDPGVNVKGGFEKDCREGAAPEALANKPDGTKSLASTMGNWVDPVPNQKAIEHMKKVSTQKMVYIEGGSGTDDIASKNKCLAVTFY